MDLWAVKYASCRSRIGDLSGGSSVRGARMRGVLASRASAGQRRLSARGVEPPGRGSRAGIMPFGVGRLTARAIPQRNFIMIMKDGKVYKNTLSKQGFLNDPRKSPKLRR